MKTVIYQYYDGETTSGNDGRNNEEYALRIGSEYIYEQDPYWRTDLGRYSRTMERSNQFTKMSFTSGII